MRRILLMAGLLLGAAAYVFLQTTPSTPRLATLAPSGALLYLEAADYGRLLREWSASRTKADWIGSVNYAVFSRTNLFSKLHDVYDEYSQAAGFLPDLPHLIEIAGSNSALALYGIRDVEFLYISRISQSELIKSQLWSVRDKFERRQAGDFEFYLRTDPASKRTVAFAFAKDYLFVATRDDLVAQALGLLGGGTGPSVASERWYAESAAAVTEPGPSELRLAMNLESVVKSDYFRSYWIQRNTSEIKKYWAGLADIGRSDGNFVESRVFLEDSAAAANSSAVASLLALVPPDAGLYKIQPASDPAKVADLIMGKLIGAEHQRARDGREAPGMIPEDERIGSVADLETRIDEQPLARDSGLADSTEAIRGMLRESGVNAVLLVESSSPVAGSFIATPSVIVLSANQNWDPATVRTALSAAGGKLWTTQQFGARWTSSTVTRYSVNRLDGLGNLMFVNRGELLVVANNEPLLAAVLDRAGNFAATTTGLSYAAGFRHTRERGNYDRMMAALDFGSGGNPSAPLFFSGNIASLSRVLSTVSEINITEQQRPGITSQKVIYRLSR